MKKFLLGFVLLAVAGTANAQCGPGGCGVGGAGIFRGRGVSAGYSYAPAYSYATVAPATSGGCSGGTTAYYQPSTTYSYPAYGAPAVCPTCTPQQVAPAAPAPPMPQATSSDPMVLASDGRYYPLSAWSRPQVTYQQPAVQYAAAPVYYAAPAVQQPAYVAAPAQVYAGPIYSAYVVETRTPAPVTRVVVRTR